MATVLLDTNFIDRCLGRDIDFFNDKEIFVCIGSFIELTHEGFYNKRDKIFDFIIKPNVFIVGNIFPIKKEIEEYPFKLNLKDHILPKPKFFEEITNNKNCINAHKDFYLAREILKERIEEIKKVFWEKQIDYKDRRVYRHFLKSCLQHRIKNHKIKLQLLPFNTLLRSFLIEKFALQPNYKYQLSDANDILICLISIYFNYFFVERKNYNVLQKIIYKRGLKDIFIEKTKICNKLIENIH